MHWFLVGYTTALRCYLISYCIWLVVSSPLKTNQPTIPKSLGKVKNVSNHKPHYNWLLVAQPLCGTQPHNIPCFLLPPNNKEQQVGHKTTLVTHDPFPTEAPVSNCFPCWVPAPTVPWVPPWGSHGPTVLRAPRNPRLRAGTQESCQCGGPIGRDPWLFK